MIFYLCIFIIHLFLNSILYLSIHLLLAFWKYCALSLRKGPQYQNEYNFLYEKLPAHILLVLLCLRENTKYKKNVIIIICQTLNTGPNSFPSFSYISSCIISLPLSYSLPFFHSFFLLLICPFSSSFVLFSIWDCVTLTIKVYTGPPAVHCSSAR